MIFLFRTLKSKKKLGEKFTEEEKEELKRDVGEAKENKQSNFERINHIMNSLPPDMLFIMRASNLVAIHNTTLGGTTRYRLLKFTDLAYANLYPNPLRRWWEQLKMLLRVFLFETFHSVFLRFYNYGIE